MKRFDYPRLGETFYEETLPSGLRVRVIPRPGFAKKFAMLYVNFGSIDIRFQENGKAFTVAQGIAHYLEHKMFDMPDGNAMQRFSETGASPNAYTGYTATVYHFECTDRFEDNLRILLDYTSTPFYTDESVEKERGIISQEILMYEDSPESRVYEDLLEDMFSVHPARYSIAGTVETIADIDAQSLYDCYNGFYVPSNMVLCVAGDVDPQSVMDIASEYFTQSSNHIAERDYGSGEPENCDTHFISSEMEVSMPMFLVGFKCSPPEKPEDALKQEIIADLASELVMGEATELYDRLYCEGLIDSGFSCGYEDLKNACFLFAAGDSSNPQIVAEEILKNAKQIACSGADDQLFGRLKRSLFGRRIRELDSFSAVCAHMAENIMDGVEYFTFPDIYDKICAEDITAFIAENIKAEKMLLSVIAPRKKEITN